MGPIKAQTNQRSQQHELRDHRDNRQQHASAESQHRFGNSIGLQRYSPILMETFQPGKPYIYTQPASSKLALDPGKYSVGTGGKYSVGANTYAAIQGANVRVGLEDSIYLGRGQIAESNAAQVLKIRRIMENLGYEIATPDEARAMLALKGSENVNF